MEKKETEILKIESLKIGYASGKQPKILLPPLTATACRGELVAVSGRNGIGKSTLLRTIIGLQPSFGGKVVIKGNDISGFSRLYLAQVAGYISTEIVRVSNMKVYDLVALGRFPHTNWIGRIDLRSHAVIIDALTKTGIKDFSYRYISELSDGERQRAMIARVLAQDTEILIMDEPTAFLDIAGKYDIVSLLKSLTREGKTIVFSTHDLNIALNLADKIWLMLKDKLVEGSPEYLMQEGAFNHLFDSSEIRFDPASGRLILENKGQDHLKYFL
jgi:iron complex transport system ATP-binding protein